MSLDLLLGRDIAADFHHRWPDEPRVLDLPDDSPIGRVITAQTIRGFLETGCAPGEYVNVFHNGEGLHPARFTADDRVAAPSVPLLLDQGCTIQLRELNRWYPPFSALCQGIQTQTGCPCYATAFITPAAAQGLDYHWDQYLGIVVQLEGSKTWELFKPKVEAPHRDHAMSTNLWQDAWVTQWQKAGPDLTVELTPRKMLILPRGWVHNPHARNATETSVHLTFVLKERSPLWVAERLTASAINDARFRAVISPADLELDHLPDTISEVRALMIDYLGQVDPGQLAQAMRYATEKETSHATL